MALAAQLRKFAYEERDPFRLRLHNLLVVDSR